MAKIKFQIVFKYLIKIYNLTTFYKLNNPQIPAKIPILFPSFSCPLFPWKTELNRPPFTYNSPFHTQNPTLSSSCEGQLRISDQIYPSIEHVFTKLASTHLILFFSLVYTPSILVSTTSVFHPLKFVFLDSPPSNKARLSNFKQIRKLSKQHKLHNLHNCQLLPLVLRRRVLYLVDWLVRISVS